MSRLLRFLLSKPLLIFSLPGLIMLIWGLVVGLGVASDYDRTRELAVGTAFITMLLMLSGLLLLFMGLVLYGMRAMVDTLPDVLRECDTRYLPPADEENQQPDT